MFVVTAWAETTIWFRYLSRNHHSPVFGPEFNFSASLSTGLLEPPVQRMQIHTLLGYSMDKPIFGSVWFQSMNNIVDKRMQPLSIRVRHQKTKKGGKHLSINARKTLHNTSYRYTSNTRKRILKNNTVTPNAHPHSNRNPNPNPNPWARPVYMEAVRK